MKRTITPGEGLFWLTVLALLIVFATGCTKQAKKTRALARAQKDFAAENYDRAEIEYLTALKVPPPEPAALLALGRIYFTQGRLPQAHAYLKKAVELQPDNPEAHARFAMACLAAGGAKEAREQALLALDKQPQNGDALLTLAQSAVSTNQIAETFKLLDAVPVAGKAGADYLVARATICLRLRQLDQAEAFFKSALEADPKSHQAYLGFGSVQLARTNLAGAETAFKMAAQVAPSRSIAPLRYAELKLKTGEPDVARKSVEEITVKTPDYIPAWVFLAQMAMNEQKTDAGSNYVETILARDPINLDALLLKANLFMARSDPTNALALFEKIQAFYGSIPAVQYRMALAQLQNREIGKARNTLNSLLSAQPGFAEAVVLNASLQIRSGDASSAIGSLVRLTKEQPDYYRAYLYLVEAYLSQHKVGEAVAVYQQMQTLFPKSPEVHVMLGALYQQQSRSQEARSAFQRALEIAPDYMVAQEKLIDLDLAENNFSAALERVRQEMSARPAAAEPYLFSAKVHIARALYNAGLTNLATLEEQLRSRLAQSPAAQEEMRGAEAALVKAIEVRPDLTLSHMMLARVYLHTDQRQKALERLAVLARTNSPSALFQIGIIQTELKNYAAARDAYEKIIADNPHDVAALNNLAYLFTEHLGNLGKAYQMAQRARDLLPHDARTADTLGWVLYRQGDYERALSLLQESAARMTLDPEVQFHLGMAHYMAGEEGPARVALERAVQSSKDFNGKDEAKKRLSVLNLQASGTDAAKLAELRQRATQDPDDVVLLLRLAEISERGGRFEEARDAYEAVLKRSPRNGRVQFRLAWLCSQRLNQPGKAMELAKSAHEILPDDADIGGLLGRLALNQRDFQWALSLLLDASRKLPDNAELAYDLGQAYYSVGRVAEAEATVEKALEKRPFAREEQSRTFLKMVKLARDPALTSNSAAEARLLLQTQADYPPALFVAAIAAELEGNFTQAASTYAKVLEFYPLFTPAIRNLALLYASHLGDDQKAYDLAMKARETLPRDRELARILGILSYRRVDYASALQYLDQSAKEKPDDAELQFYKGMAHLHLKQQAEGTKALQRAIELNVDAKLAQEAKRALQETGKGS